MKKLRTTEVTYSGEYSLHSSESRWKSIFLKISLKFKELFIKLSSVIQTYLMKHTSFSFVVVVQSLSRIRLFTTPWTTACQVSLSSTISLSLLRFMSIESAILSNHLILCHPLLLLPTIFPSIRVFSKESALCIRWPKYWSFNVNYLQYIKFQNSGWDVAHDACC